MMTYTNHLLKHACCNKGVVTYTLAKLIISRIRSVHGYLYAGFSGIEIFNELLQNLTSDQWLYMCTMQAANANNYKTHAYNANGEVIYNNSIGTSFHCTLVCIPTWPSGPTNINLELKTPPSSPMVSMF